MKVALIHDYLIRMGGAERVLLEFHNLFPEAPIYTLLYDKEKMGKYLERADVRVSFLKKFPKFLKHRQKHLLPFLPVAAESFDLRDFDLVISSSSAFAKSIITRPDTIHVCYCHSPSRFLWDWSHEYIREMRLDFVRAALAKILVHYLRVWDKSSSKRVDYWIANSRATRDKIKKYYRQDARIIYPPVALPSWEEFLAARDGNYFLIISQLTPYKKIDLAVEAFNKLKLPLIIIGGGSQRQRLEKQAGENIKILGWQSERVKKEFLKNCTAFIFAGEDDFGIAPVEAMGWGKPVLAYGAGGACETVISGVTGEFFDDAVPEILADGVRRLRDNLPNYSPLVIRKRAEKFSESTFRQEVMDFMKKIGYNGEKRESQVDHFEKTQSAIFW
jgi:glycosyltransferase involved in cell wall biosynthesis